MTRFGCFLPSYAASGPIDVSSILGTAQDAERLGLDHVWVGDHFLWRVGILSPMATLAAVATATERIRLGTGVYQLNLRHPSITAKDVASVDVLSGGRVIFGVGIGGEDPDEYDALGVSHARRGQQLDENLEAVTSLLRQEGRAVSGSLVSVPAFTMEPAPVQDPVPLWVGGRAQVVVERAARTGQGWFPVWVSPSRIGSAWEAIEEIRGTRDGFDVALNIFTCLGPSREEAAARLTRHLGNAYGLPFETFERYSAYGTVDDIIETLTPYAEAGVTDFVLNIAGADVREQLSELAAVASAVRG
jgi:probable F420-dependent oxidoreductase